MTVRSATKKDLPKMIDLLQQLFELETDFTPTPEKQREGLIKLLEQPLAELFVAELNGSVVGMCTIQILISTAEGQCVGVIEDVVVDRSCRGKGVGSTLLAHVEDWAEKSDLTRLQLQADKENIRALKFYCNQNWKRTKLIGLWKK